MKMNYAGFWPRLMAHNVDMAILLPCYYALSYLIQSNLVLLSTCLCITLTYEIVFIHCNWHATPGKKLAHLEVVNQYGAGLSLGRSAFRTFNKLISVLTLFIGYIFIMVHPKKKGLHDLLPKTFVIFSDPK